MKELIFVLIALFSLNVNSQFISVTPNTNSTQIVNTILLNGACVGATNITTRTGTDFGSFNGIGSFTNTNPSFPMTKGIVLSTGNITSAGGPNTTTLDEGTIAWTGDANLVTALGNPAANYLNASVLEFDFTPISPNFSFDFIFASEEYGGFQCAGFPDAFAFLLTNTNTNITTNLAVLPSSTTPITVEKVRDNAFNSTCASNNANFFGAFYGGSNGNISPTNFNGQTKLLTASSTLIPGITYHIKLVIADRNDVKYDSAVFISGSSFNIGQDVLGPDVNIASGNAACFGTNYTILSGLDPLLYDIKWTIVGNATVLGTTESLVVSSSGNYQLSYKERTSACAPEINTINIEFYPEIKTIAPINIIKCEVVGGTSYSFDIAQNTSILLAGLPAMPLTTAIQYFSDILCTFPISSPYVINSATPNQTVFVKITNTITNCFTVKSFVLTTSPETTINPINGGTVTLCESAVNSGTQSVVFNSYDNSFLGGQPLSQFNVTYYLTFDAANAGTTGQLIKTGYVVSNATTIWVRVENKTDKNCFKTSTFVINVAPKPEITTAFKNIFVCTRYILPALNPSTAIYSSQINGGGTIWPVGTILTKPTLIDFIDVFVTLNTPNCPDSASFRVVFVDINEIDTPNINNCDKFIVPSLPYGDFYTASHLNGGNGGTKLTPLSQLTLPSTQTIYFYFESIDEPNCFIEKSFTINIDPSPVLPEYENIYKCVGEFYTLLPLDRAKNPIINYYSSNIFISVNIIPEGTRILATQTIYVHAESGLLPCVDDDIFTVFIGLPNPVAIIECEKYILPVLPVGKYYPNSGGPSTTNIEIPFGTEIFSSRKIYHYAKSDPNDLPVSNCVYDEAINIKIVLPIVPTTINLNVTACGIFNLPTLPIIPINTTVTPNQTYQQFTYNTKADGTGITINIGSVISVSQTIYVFVIDTFCKRGVPMVINIKPYPLIPLSPIYPKCETFSIAKPANVEFYYGPNRTGGIIPDNTVFTQDIRIYAYSETLATPPCGLDYPIDIQIYFTKAIQYPNVTQCVNYTLPVIVQPNADDNNAYYSGSRLNGGTSGILLPPGTIFKLTETVLPNGIILPVIQTIYVYNKKTARFLCEDEKTFNVTINLNPEVSQPNIVIACDKYILPPVTVGNYFTGNSGTGTAYFAGNEINTTQTLYVYFAGNPSLGGCSSSQKSFSIIINKVDKLNDVSRCYIYALPTLVSGNYFSGSNGTLPITNNTLTTSQKIYIWKRFSTGLGTFCESQTSFNVTITPAPNANINNVLVASRTFCDTDGLNDGKFLTNLTQYNSTILGTQTGTEFSVAYFETLFDANLNVNPITTPTFSQNIFVRVNNNTLSPSCYDVKPLNVIINKLPEPTNPEKLIICTSNETGEILNSVNVDSGLDANDYTFDWTDKSGSTISSANNLPEIIVAGTYSVVTTNKITGCFSKKVTTNVILSQIAVASLALSENFSNNQFVTVAAVGVNGGSGNYEYQFDENNYQDSNVFNNVPYGNHKITVRDKNGCGIVVIPVIIINYPKYFTPNNDGANDVWNIIGLENQLTSNVFIFDRSGKLLTQIKPYQMGWDGKYNGELMPSTDYWFEVRYLENGIDKTFKSHFAMKR